MLHETVEGLGIHPDGVYVDLTFGGGGHSREIMRHLGEKGHLYGFDQDLDAMKGALDDPRFTFVRSNFRFLNVRGEQNTKVEHCLEEQIFWCTVRLDIVGEQLHLSLVVIGRAVVDIFHIGTVYFENTETNIKIGSGKRAFFLDFFSGTTDTLFADVTDGFVA